MSELPYNQTLDCSASYINQDSVHEKKFNQWNPRPGQRGLLILPAQATRVSFRSKAKGPGGAAHSVSSLINRTKLQRSVGPTQTDVSAKLPIMIWSSEMLHKSLKNCWNPGCKCDSKIAAWPTPLYFGYLCKSPDQFTDTDSFFCRIFRMSSSYNAENVSILHLVINNMRFYVINIYRFYKIQIL